MKSLTNNIFRGKMGTRCFGMNCHAHDYMPVNSKKHYFINRVFLGQKIGFVSFGKYNWNQEQCVTQDILDNLRYELINTTLSFFFNEIL